MKPPPVLHLDAAAPPEPKGAFSRSAGRRRGRSSAVPAGALRSSQNPGRVGAKFCEEWTVCPPPGPSVGPGLLPCLYGMEVGEARPDGRASPGLHAWDARTVSRPALGLLRAGSLLPPLPLHAEPCRERKGICLSLPSRRSSWTSRSARTQFYAGGPQLAGREPNVEIRPRGSYFSPGAAEPAAHPPLGSAQTSGRSGRRKTCGGAGEAPPPRCADWLSTSVAEKPRDCDRTSRQLLRQHYCFHAVDPVNGCVARLSFELSLESGARVLYCIVSPYRTCPTTEIEAVCPLLPAWGREPRPLREEVAIRGIGRLTL